jgi:lysophospholipase L1-like esterase
MKRSLKLLATLAIGSTALALIAQQTAAPPITPAQLQLLKDFAGLDRYASANATLAPMEKGRVVFFGDSITDAWVRNGGTFFPGKPYVNRGISGQTTPQMLIRLRQDVIDLHPAAVVILAGTNDIAGNTGPSTLQMMEDNFTSMAELAQANHIHVILASVLPAADYPWRKGLEPAPKIKALNQWIATYCAQKKFTYLDYYTAMAGPDGGMKPGISHDGVHPNAAGYAIMEPLAEAAIAKAMKSKE